MANETCIRDPVHNYIYLTEVESQLVKHPLFQRLRFITQNGAVYYTYPSNRNCRFLHSLGCMILGGDIFLSATENLNDQDVVSYLLTAYSIINSVCTDHLTVKINDVVKKYAERKDKTFIRYGLDLGIVENNVDDYNLGPTVKIRFAKAVLFQSIRLACVLHDIGHFPFSHSLESAIGQYVAHMQSTDTGNEIFLNFEKLQSDVEMEIHENIGIEILDVVIPSSENAFHKLCRYLARTILTEKPSEYQSIVRPLTKIVSGELDADRLDYCMRDPRASGLELGAFDIERIVDNFTLIKDGESYEILPRVQALSAIESFYHQRYLLYKYLIYHHSKVRMDEIVKEITRELFHCYLSGRKPIRQILEDYCFSFLWQKYGSEDYYYCNENWFYSLLQSIYLNIRTIKVPDAGTDRLKQLIEIFLFRKTESVFSFFKRYDQYRDFMNDIISNVRNNSKKKLPANADEKAMLLKLRGVIESSISYNNAEEIKKEIFHRHKAICLIAILKPKGIKYEQDGDSRLRVIQENTDTGKTPIPISKVSPYIHSLNATFRADQFLHIFIVHQDIKRCDIKKFNQARINRFLFEKYRRCC